ncbi:hypothetical protein LCGC14_1701100, partial [marine sediment metagenome]
KYVVGSDIQREFFIGKQALAGQWDLATTEQTGTSIVVGLLAPWLSRLPFLDLLTVYKLILPIFLGLVPVLLYLAFRKQMGGRSAFIAAIFFVAMPAFSLESAQIVKAMVAEMFLALMVLVMVGGSKPGSNTKTVLVAAVAVTILAHYTVGIMALFYLTAIFLVKIFAWPLRWSLLERKMLSPFAVGLVLLLGGALFLGYYSIASDGVILKVVSRTGSSYEQIAVAQVKAGIKETGYNPEWEGIQTTPKYSWQEPVDVQKTVYLQKQPSMVQTAIGLDFFKASGLGKVFRVFLYLTELLILIGGVHLLRNHRRYRFTSEFIACIGASIVLLFLCVFVPMFSSIINMSRFYHFSLFFLAPLFVIGCDAVSGSGRLKRALPAIILVPYLLFTSGLVFEASKSNITHFLDMPYSFALSAERTGVARLYKSDDLAAIEWLNNVSDQERMIISDVPGYSLLVSNIEDWGRLKTPLAKTVRISQQLTNVVHLGTRPALDEAPDGSYILLTSWNTTTGDYIEHRDIGPGLRVREPLPEMPYPMVFSRGDAVVLLKSPWVVQETPQNIEIEQDYKAVHDAALERNFE